MVILGEFECLFLKACGGDEEALKEMIEKYNLESTEFICDCGKKRIAIIDDGEVNVLGLCCETPKI